MRHLRPSLLVLATLTGFSGVLGCGARPDPALGPPPGVVLFVIDTLRWDALGTPDGGSTALPSLAKFARGGVTFTEASAPAPWTLPSVASLLTGLQPRRHGSQMSFGDSSLRRIPPTVQTVAEVLRAKGWSTAACTAGGWVSPELGLGGGFDQFTTNFDLHDPSFYLAPWQEQRPKDRPFFLFLHTCAPHDPYGDKDRPLRLDCRPDPEVKALGQRLIAALDGGGGVDDALYAEYVAVRCSDPCSRRGLDLILGSQRNLALLARFNEWMLEGWRRAPGAELPSRLKAAYERGLGYVDHRIALTLDALESVGLPEGTLVVIAGDHGESFGDQGQLYHGQSMGEAILRVPLVMRSTGRLPAGRVAQGGCSLVDVMPTILDLAGVPAPEGLDGRSLVPLATAAGAGHPALAEGETTASPERPPLGLASVRTPTAKWVLAYDLASGAPVREELYDLVLDPEQRSPIVPLDASPFGSTFCRAVDRVRADLRSRYGMVARAPACE